MKNVLVRQPVGSFPICMHIRVFGHTRTNYSYLWKMDLFACLYAHYQFVRTLRIETHRHISLAYEKWTSSPTFSTHLSYLFAYQEKQTRYEKWTTIKIMLFAHFSDNTWFFFRTLSSFFFFPDMRKQKWNGTSRWVAIRTWEKKKMIYTLHFLFLCFHLLFSCCIVALFYASCLRLTFH